MVGQIVQSVMICMVEFQLKPYSRSVCYFDKVIQRHVLTLKNSPMLQESSLGPP